MSEHHDHEQALQEWIAAQPGDEPEGLPSCAVCAERWREWNALGHRLKDWGEGRRAEIGSDDATSGIEAAQRVLGPLLAERHAASARPVGRKSWLRWGAIAAGLLLVLWLNRTGRRAAPLLPDGAMLTPGTSGWSLVEPIGHVTEFDVFSWERSAYPGASYQLIVRDGAEGEDSPPRVRVELLDPTWTPNVELPDTVYWRVIVKDAEGRDVEQSSGWASRSPR